MTLATLNTILACTIIGMIVIATLALWVASVRLRRVTDAREGYNIEEASSGNDGIDADDV